MPASSQPAPANSLFSWLLWYWLPGFLPAFLVIHPLFFLKVPSPLPSQQNLEFLQTPSSALSPSHSRLSLMSSCPLLQLPTTHRGPPHRYVQSPPLLAGCWPDIHVQHLRYIPKQNADLPPHTGSSLRDPWHREGHRYAPFQKSKTLESLITHPFPRLGPSRPLDFIHFITFDAVYLTSSSPHNHTSSTWGNLYPTYYVLLFLLFLGEEKDL